MNNSYIEHFNSFYVLIEKEKNGIRKYAAIIILPNQANLRLIVSDKYYPRKEHAK